MIAATAGPMLAPFGTQRPLTIAAGVVQGVPIIDNKSGPNVLYGEVRAANGTLLVVGTSPNLFTLQNTRYLYAATLPVVPFLVRPGDTLYGLEGNGAAAQLLITTVTP